MKKFGWLLGLAVLAGCDDEETAGTVADASVRDGFVGRDQGIRDLGVEPDRGPDAECAVNADCEDGETCDDGECVAVAPECVGDEDCAVGEVCEGGECVPEEAPECVNDDDCGAGEVCEGGECVPDEAPECVDDNDCGAGEVCEGGECVPDEAPECVDDGDCGLGQTCQGGSCEDVECVNDGDCGAGETCEAGACVDAPGCQNDADCAQGEVCEAGACVDDVPPPECQRNADCGAGEICVGGVCEDAPPPPQCQGHADCLPGQICVDGVCEDNVDPDCQNDADCAPGQVCINGLCQGGQPVDCAGAQPLAGFGQVFGTTLGLENGAAGSCGGAEAPEAVYVFVPDQAGEICVNTLGSDYDTLAYVRQGDCNDAAAELDCNDDDLNNPGLHAAMTIPVMDDAPIYIFVDGFAAAGDFVLNVTEGPCGELVAECAVDENCAPGEVCVAGECVPDAPVPCAADADCAAGELCVDGFCTFAEDGSCEAPFLVEAFGDQLGTTEGADDFGASCGGGARGPEDVYAFAVNAPGVLCLRTAGSSYDTVLHVRAGDCLDAAAEIACNDDSANDTSSEIELVVEPDLAYFVFVDGFGGAAGDYTLTITDGPCDAGPVACVDDLDCAFGEICVDGACQPAGACVDDADCAAGEACVDGACQALPAECVADADCPEGEACVEGICAVPGTCDAPFLIDAFGAYEASVVGGPALDRGVCGGNGPENVFVFAVDAPGPICLSTAGSDFDTVLHVRADACADVAAEVACNDDPAAGTQAELTVDAVADVAYYVFVDSFNVGGNYVLTVSPGPCGEAPAECAADADCAAGEVCIAGVCEPAAAAGTCENPFVIEAFGPIDGTTVGAPAQQAGLCGGRGNEIVHAFSLVEAGEVCLSTAGSGYDTVLHVRANDCGDAAAEVACNDDSVGLQSEITLAGEANVVYYVFVDGFGGAGDYTLTVTPGPCGAEPPAECAVDADCAEGELCDAGVCVAAPVGNGTCEAPTPILQVGALNGATAGQGVHGGSCGGGPASPEAVYVFSVDAATPVCLDTNGSRYDTVLYVRTACGDAASEVGCDDDDGVGTQSLLEIQAEANVDYFVFVDGFTGFGGSTSQGDFTLNLNIGPCP